MDAINVGETILLPENGKPKRDFLHVEDFARACQAFIDSDVTHGLYNLGGGYKNALTLRELVEKIEKIVGANAEIEENVKVSPPVPYNYVSDISKIEHELGWKPSIGIEEGLKTLLI